MDEIRQDDIQQIAPAPKVHGVVLAGAYRWGESPFEQLGPRPTLPVALTPLVCRVLDWLRAGGIARATICANSASAREVRRCVAAAELPGLDLDHVEDWTPRGPAGCVRDAAGESDADLLLVVDGTIVPGADIPSLLRHHLETGAAITAVVDRDPDGGGLAGRRLRPCGIYVFARRVLRFVPEVGYHDIKEKLIGSLHRAGEAVVPYEADAPCPRASGLRAYLTVNAWMLEKLIAERPAGFRVRDVGLIHESAHVAPSATLVGPVLVGPGARVAGRAAIVGPVTIGRGALVADEALVCRSVLHDRSTIRGHASVDRSAVGEGAVVESHSHLYRAVALGALARTRGSAPAPAPASAPAPRAPAEAH